MSARPPKCFPLLLPKSPFAFCSLPEGENYRAAIREISLRLSAGSRAPDFMLILKLVLLCFKRSFLLNLTFSLGFFFLWDTLKKEKRTVG